MKVISFPKVRNFDIQSLQKPTTYIGAAGFEDRALAILNQAKEHKETFEYVIAVQYEPRNARNKEKEFQELAYHVVSKESNTKWVKYKRENPSEFDQDITVVRQVCSQTPHIWLDISAMSKLLILIVLQAIRELNSSLTITYVEPEIYHPIKEKFDKEFETAKRLMPQKVPELLSSGVYNITTTSALSSVAMQGYPTVLAIFPTFNYNLFAALLNEVASQDLIVLEGDPLRQQNKWRLEAIRQVNQQFYPSAKKTRVASTFHYDETVNQLEELYQEYQYTHEFVIAPANSKLQAVGVFFFKQMHPEVQVIYATPRGYFDPYTEGISQIHQISFPNFGQFIESLDGHRHLPLAELWEKLSLRKD